MPATKLVEPALFDGLMQYATKVESDKKVSSEPTLFCDNFYLQFFQNRMLHEITGFGKADKESAVKLRLKVETTEAEEIGLLLTWFERYCDVRYDVFSEEYGEGTGDALSVFQNYLETLLERITGWARLEKLTEIEHKSVDARAALQKALQSIKKE